MKKIKAGVLGAAGFTGGELVRLLLDHPRVELAAAASASHAGEPVHKAHPHLRGRAEGLSFAPRLDPSGLDCVFLASGHGEAMEAVPRLLAQGREGLKVIDLSGDFRLRDAGLYPRWYGREHGAGGLLPSFCYGLTELKRSELAGASRVANPGCIATAAALALAPLAKAGWKGKARVTAVTGSSGSGVKPSETTHHPLREGNMRAYKPLRHQHAPEVEQLLDDVAGRPSLKLAMTAVSGPFVRGIYCVCHLEAGQGDVRDIFEGAYAGCRFIRLLEQPPELNAVQGSNYCDVFATAEGPDVLVIAALDNLVKGAAGQAVQNLNVMMGWDEAEGLGFPGIYP